MPISGRTWSQLFLCALACAAQVHTFQSERHSDAASQSDRRSILGRVVEAGTNAPLKNVVVAILSPSGDQIDAIRTRADGTFAFTLVPSGRWNLEVYTNGYQRQTRKSEEVPAIRATSGFVLALTKLPGH